MIGYQVKIPPELPIDMSNDLRPDFQVVRKYLCFNFYVNIIERDASEPGWAEV